MLRYNGFLERCIEFVEVCKCARVGREGGRAAVPGGRPGAEEGIKLIVLLTDFTRP